MELLRDLRERDRADRAARRAERAKAALSVADRGIVLSLGRVVADDDARPLAADDALRHAYLGF